MMCFPSKSSDTCRLRWLSQWMLVAGIFCDSFATLSPTAMAAEPKAKPTDDATTKFFSQRCQACHSGAKPKGDFRLESLSQDFANKENRERWLKVLEQV